MIPTGGLYVGKESNFLAMYRFQKDLYQMLPKKFPAEYIAHFEYEKGGKKGGGDILRIPKDAHPESITKLSKTITKEGRKFVINNASWRRKGMTVLDQNNTRYTQKKQNVDYQITFLEERERKEVEGFFLADIEEFCEGVAAKEPKETYVQRVKKIIPVTKLETIDPTVLLTTGKQENTPDCIFQANIDFGKGCTSSWIPGKNAYFDGEFFHNFWFYPWGECIYCYAGRNHRAFAKTIYKFDKQRLLEELTGGFVLDLDTGETLGKPVEILRFGKRTEPYDKIYRDNFLSTLEACIETGTRGIIPTKFLPFDKDIAELIKRTNSSVLFSLDWDEFSLGAKLKGCDNEWRIEQAIRYKEAGANANFYPLYIIGKDLLAQEEEIRKAQRKYGMGIQNIPMRFKRKSLAAQITGIPEHLLLPQKNLFDNRGGRVYKYRQELAPLISAIRPDLIEEIGDNQGSIRMCHHDPNLTYCGGCFLEGEKGRILKTPKHPQVKFRRKKRKIKSETPKPKDKNQLSLF